MAKPERKEAERTERRASRRGVLRRGRGKGEGGSSKIPEPGSREETAPKGGKDPRLDDAKKVSTLKVSTLLETTGEEVKQLLQAADDAAEKIREAGEADSRAGGHTAGKGDEVSSLVSKINDEARQVLEAADEAAEKIREEAREEARQLIQEARRRAESATGEQMSRVSEMTEQVLGELAAVQGQLDSLRNAFDQAIRSMSTDLGVERTDVWDTKRNGELESDEESDALRQRLGRRPRRRAAAQEPEGISEGARLLALQQMMAGVDAEVIEARLKNEFGIEDPKPILDWMGMHAQRPQQPQKPEKR